MKVNYSNTKCQFKIVSDFKLHNGIGNNTLAVTQQMEINIQIRNQRQYTNLENMCWVQAKAHSIKGFEKKMVLFSKFMYWPYRGNNMKK